MREKIINVLLQLKNSTVATSLVIFLLIGFGIGQLTDFDDYGTKDGSEQIRLGMGEYTNPLLECEVAKGTIDSPKVVFDKEMQVFVKSIQNNDPKLEISVYYRDLNNGPVLGVNENTIFMPASLLKVPVMMSYYKHAESDPLILSKKIVFTKDKEVEFTQEFPPEKKLVVGEIYTIQELIERMITYSDNQALALLWPSISVDEYIELYRLLGVDPDTVSKPDHGISVKEYSRFFRILFNSSFLSQANSEKALKLLAGTKFDEGIRKSIPSDIKIAEKFGERDLPNSLKQFHECGIVYYPDHPYLICVMTRGPDAEKLTDVISSISNYVFLKVKEQYPLK